MTATELVLGPVEQIPIGEGRAFDVQGRQVAVFRLRSGQLHAVSAVCPHRGGPLADGQTDGTVVLCPLHLNAFDLSTGLSPTGAPGIDVWSVALDGDGQIVIQAQSITQPPGELEPPSGIQAPGVIQAQSV